MRGTVVVFTTDGADDVIDAFAKKYTGADRTHSARPARSASR